MKFNTIKKHLKSYSIFENRKTTINHAFASALAIRDSYSEEKVKEALEILRMNPEEELDCFYCIDKKDAETWDHVVNLVKDGKFQGYGHQIGNLIPCCKSCNSAKGSKTWEKFLESRFEGERLKEKKIQLQEYTNNVINTLDITNELVEDLQEYYEIREKIFSLMKEADIVAERVRKKVEEKIQHSS